MVFMHITNIIDLVTIVLAMPMLNHERKYHLEIVCSNTKNFKYNRCELNKCEGGVAIMYTISIYIYAIIPWTNTKPTIVS